MSDPQQGIAGYVYILINAAYPEFIKIGLTTLDPNERARRLSMGTGIPAPYAVAWPKRSNVIRYRTQQAARNETQAISMPASR